MKKEPRLTRFHIQGVTGKGAKADGVVCYVTILFILCRCDYFDDKKVNAVNQTLLRFSELFAAPESEYIDGSF